MEHEGKAMNGHCNGSHKHDEPLTNGHKHASDQDKLVSKFTEKFTIVADDEKSHKNVLKEHTISTVKHVPKLGVMLVGLGGNNGSTFVAGLLANKKKLEWDSKVGPQKANFYGSFT